MALALVLPLISLSTQAQVTVTNGVVAYWNFDGNLLDSIKDFHGTARGTNAIRFVDGRAGFGKAIKLDGGNQFVEITGGNENELEFLGGSMSIAGWFKVDAFDTGWQALISKGEGSAYRVARRDPTSTIAYAGGVPEGPNNTPNVNDGRWHHFVAISDAATNAFGTALYIDGNIYSVNTNKPALATNNFPLMIGENPGARNREWEGEIDDIAIWNRVLTRAEVATLYANPLGAFLPNQAPAKVTSGLVAYWDFDGDLLDSIKDFHGTARGTNAIPFVDGRAGFGKAIKLDGGNQFVEITGGNENELEFLGGSMSIAGWFKVDAFDTGWQALISKGEGSAYRVARRDPTSTIAYAGGVPEGPNNTPNVNDRQWHHFVAISDAATNAFGTALYIDGNIYSVNTNKPALATNNFPLMIGENPGARNREWEGEIDDISIWNRVLTSGEVAALHGKPLSTFLPGAAAELYKIGLNFGANEYPTLVNAGKLAAGSMAGAPGVAQPNWNNLDPQNGTNTVIVGDSNGSSVPTTVEVRWTSNGLWANTGRGENNNVFPTNSPNRILMTGYLDTGNATTTTVTITNIPASLAAGYDLYVYAQGGVAGRGGGYRILDGASTNVLKDYVRAQSPANPTNFVQVPVPPTGTNTHGAGNYIVFSGLTASSIRIEATTAGGLGFSATPRAPINAIQLVKAAAAVSGPSISVARNATGAPVITYTGTLQSSTSVAGPYSAVANATSPFTVNPSDPARFYRSSQP
jgi:hypothetical protein